MRLSEDVEIILSEDDSTDPKLIHFKKSEAASIDTELLIEDVVLRQSFAVGTHSINMGAVAAGKWFYIKPTTTDITVTINGSNTPLTVRAGKVFSGWISITSLSITTTAVTVVTIVVAGE